MTHREEFGTPGWVNQLNEDVIVRDADDTSWYMGGYNGMPTRFHGDGKYVNAYDHGFSRKYNDETSLRSRSTLSRRHRRNTCCLIIFLVFAALLVAIGIGLMVYYLLRPDGTKYQARIANGSLPLLNVPYTQDMKDPNSESFKNIETSLCKEIDNSFRRSSYADQYEYCKVESLRLDDTPLPCACSNITSPLRSSNVRATINFGFREEMYKDDIQDIIEKQIRRIYGVDYDVLMLDDYVIDIASHVVTSTIKPIPDSGVRASLTIWVYNMTYTNDLADSNSDSFKTLAGPFCNDLRRIFLMSTLKSRYHSCQVKGFRDDPAIVNTDIWFTGTDVFGLPTSVKTIVLDNAREVNVSSTIRKMIGTLLITPKTGNDSNVSVITIPVNPETTISPTPSTRPPKWKDGMPYVEALLNFTGVDYNVSLWDTNSDFFTSHADKFCKALERMIMQSNWKKHFYDCNLVNMYPPASGQFYPTLRTVVHINSNIHTADELVDIIKVHGDKYIFPGNIETYRVGDLYVVLKDGRFDIYSSIYGTDTTIEYPTTTVATLLPSIFTTFSFSSPTMTPGDTVKPPISTIVIVYNATAAFIESELIDFNYTPDLQDTTSARFLSIEGDFCEDIDRYFMTSSLHMYYKNCKITGFTSDPKLSFVLQFTTRTGEHLQSTVPSVLIQKAPKVQIRQMTALNIGDLNLLYEKIGFTVSVTNFTFDMTPTISPTGTIVVPSTKIPVKYTAALLNVLCDVAMDISGGLQNKNSQVFLLMQRNFCDEVRRLFSLESTTSKSYLECYVIELRSDTSKINFHTIFGTDATEAFGQAAIDVIHRLAQRVIYEQVQRLDIGGIVMETDSCSMNVYPVNYTVPKTTVFPTLTPTSQIILPTIGPDHCLRNPCENDGTCVDEPTSYSCTCASGFSGRNCEIAVPVDGGWSPWSAWTVCTETCGRGTQDRYRICSNPAPKHNGKTCMGSAIDLRDCNTQLCPDIDECKLMPDACENGGTCRNKQDGYDCICYPGYIGDRCETVVDRCASNPCKNGASCTGSQAKLCVCTSGWSGDTCEDDEDECKRVPNICKFNGTCVNEFGSFSCDCVEGRTGPTCNEGIDECLTINPCQNNAQCLDTDYSYTCVCKSGWMGKNCTEDDDECSMDICENGGTCKNTIGSFECTCPSGWTGPICDLRYNECKGANPCLNDGICVDTTSDFQCLCKPEYTGQFCQIDVNECIEDPNICNGHGVCENLEGGFKCICEFEWEGERCDFDHNECTDTSLDQLCYNNGECINQWGSYKCNCAMGWSGDDCKTDINECTYTPPICLHNGACANTDGGYNCTCSSGWTGDRCQIDLDECNTTFPCQNNATCTNKVGSFLCTCTSGWKGLLCTIDRNECVESPGICRNGGTCYNEEGDYKCDCPPGRGGKNCDSSTDPCNDIVCAHGGTCYIDSNGDAKCDCTALFQGENCEEDFDECTTNPCSEHGTCVNLPGTFYCECDVGFTGDFCEIDEDECLFFPCVNGACVNTRGSFRCDCYSGWTGPSCNVDKSECSLLANPCSGNGRCKEIPGSYTCFCYFGYTGERCETDINECEEIQCENGGVCWNLPGGYQCNCTQYWTGPFCSIDLNECTTQATPCLNGGTCRNRDFGYDCTCPSTWRGPTCNEDVDECMETPGLCQNDGTCVNRPGNFRCDCKEGYIGEYCQIDDNECITKQPCMNGATCKNIDGSYECTCPKGYEGMDCEIDINECLEDPCKNGATCLNSPPGDYRCTCTDEWNGKNCEIEVDRCPDCVNGGTCVEENNDFTCACPAGWEGEVCQDANNSSIKKWRERKRNKESLKNKLKYEKKKHSLSMSPKPEEIASKVAQRKRAERFRKQQIELRKKKEAERKKSKRKNKVTIENDLHHSPLTIEIFNNRMQKCRAVYKLKQALPKTPCKRTAVLSSILQTKSPTIKSLQRLNIITSEKSKQEYELGKSVIANISTVLKSTKHKRNDDARKTVQIITASSSGENISFKHNKKSLARSLGISQRRIAKSYNQRLNVLDSESSSWTYIKRKTRNDAIPEDVKKLAYNFWLDPENSRPSGNKKDVKRTRLGPSVYSKHPVYVLEKTQTEVYESFKKKYTSTHINQRTFEKTKPYFIRAATARDRITCCCRYHVEAKELFSKCMSFRRKHTRDIRIYEHLNDLAEETLCQKNQTTQCYSNDCLSRKCSKCGIQTVALADCEKSSALSDATVKWNKYEYINIGERKKLSLVQKETKPNEMFEYFMKLLETYPAHQFRATWQNSQFRSIKENLPIHHCLVVHDYSENYQCKDSVEIQSRYFQKTEVSIHVSVIYRHAVLELDGFDSFENDPHIVSELFFVISPDVQHDQYFSYTVQKLVKQYIDSISYPVEVMHEYTDGCASQYKSKNCLGIISNICDELKYDTFIRNYFETSHAKGVQDASGGYLKNQLDLAIFRGSAVIQSAHDVYMYCQNNLQDTKSETCKRRIFRYVDEIDRSIFKIFKPVHGIRTVHQVQSTKGSLDKITIRPLSCYSCDKCSCGRYNDCENTDISTTTLTVRQDTGSAQKIQPVTATATVTDMVSHGTVIALYTDEIEDYYVLQAKGCAETLLTDETDAWGAYYTAGTQVVRDINECDTQPDVCMNGATCKNEQGDYMCECMPGYGGKHCEQNLDDCMPNPCLFGGTCIDEINSYTCLCPPGRIGDTCQGDEEECQAVSPPCQNGATCANTIGSFECQCTDYWTGDLCDIDKNECLTVTCMHGGVCNNTLGSFTCEDCDDGWEGQLCDKDIDECPNVKCLNGGTCFNLDGSYFCYDCNKGWEGQRCEIDINECSIIRCLHGGTCVNTDGSYYCENCDDGWQGQRCEEDKNECSTIQCMNGGICVNTNGSFYCEACDKGWEGQLCDTDIDECMVTMTTEMPCKNGASCLNTDGSYICICKSFYQGPDCSEDKDECAMTPPICENGGTCTNEIGSYRCDCTDFWMGDQCDIDVNECVVFGSLACTGNGICNNTMGNYLCNCSDPYTGERCDEDKNECDITPPICLNGGTCNNYFGSYDCDCDTGFEGDHCGTNIDECNLGICLNAVSCEDTFGSYKCTCENGWTGPNCDTDINECNDNLCMNGATCSNSAGSVQCICTDGWEGLVCDKDINECLTVDICKNGATCQNKNGGYMCICTPGWEGPTCSIDINECLIPDWCKNGGTCDNTDGSYNCLCSDGWEGQMCEIDKNECIVVDICKNEATCENIDGGYNCMCMVGWEGMNCDIDINECLTSGLCKNGGTCENTDGSYMCLCSDGWEGQMCEMDKNECRVVDICKNEGTCENIDGGYKCMCVAGWEGMNCDIDINECLTSGLCQNGGTCDNTDGSYNCLCSDGWEGQMCEIDKNECMVADICKNEATCENMDGDYNCMCVTGWEGKNCDIDINECLIVNICENGASCENTDGGYMCMCTDGWEGPNCNIDKDECLMIETCENEATCVNTDGSYTCTCTSGWEGQKCDTDINECPDVCQNGGFCRNTPGSFNCTCIGDWTGPTCDLVGGKTFEFDFETVGLVITPELLDRQSDQFQRRQELICQDIGDMVSAQFVPFEGCRIKSFVENPPGLTLQLTFDADQPDELKTNIMDLLFEIKDKERFGDVYGIRVGDMVLKHSYFISTVVTMNKRLTNFTFTNSLNDENSLDFQRYVNAFCTQVNQLMATNAATFPDYLKCELLGFSYDPNTDETSFEFSFEFEGTKDVALIQSNFDVYLNSNLPKFRFDRYEAVMFGDFYIYIRDLPNFTVVPLSYELLDVQWDGDLANNQSAVFNDQSGPFCNAMETLIKQHSQYAGSFDRCSVQSYTDGDFVTVKLTMDYFEELDIPMIQSEISNIIYNFTQRERYSDQYVGYRVEDLILYDSFATYFEVPFDAWIANFTFNLFDYGAFKDSLLNSSSEDFKDKQKAFCDGDVINEFKGLSGVIQNSSYGERLLRCFVHSYTFDEFSLTDKLTSTVSLLFNDIDPVLKEELIGIIDNSFPKYAVGPEEEYFFIGYDLVLIRGVDEIKVNKSGYILDVTTTPMPVLADSLSMRFPLLNFTYSDDYLNTSSDLYLDHEKLLCYNLTFILKGANGLPRFGGCGNMNFMIEDDTTYVTFDLGFLDDIENKEVTVNKTLEIIKERARRINVISTGEESSVTVIHAIGPFLIYQDSLQPQITNPELFSNNPSSSSPPLSAPP